MEKGATIGKRYREEVIRSGFELLSKANPNFTSHVLLLESAIVFRMQLKM